MAGLLAVMASGCRSAQEIQLLERELRIQEDALYEMEDELEKVRACLDSCRRENHALRHQLGAAPLESAPLRTEQLPEGTYQYTPPEVEIPAFRAPIIDPLPDDGSESALPDEAFYEALPHEGRPAGRGGMVQRITLNQMLTGGEDRDGLAGDEGIRVVIEPRDRANRIVPAAGSLVVSVRDPGAHGPSSQVAIWEFTADEAESFFQEGELRQGIHLELPWPGVPPARSPLEVVVELRPADGRVLVARQDIDVDLPAVEPLVWQPPENRRGRSAPATGRPLAKDEPRADRSAARPAGWTSIE